jgi:integrase/recombinase XerD
LAKADPRGFGYLLNAFLESMAVRNYSERTIAGRKTYLGYFMAWCEERGVSQPIQVTRAILERYQRYLYHYRNPKTGRPLSFGSQFRSLTSVRAFFKWCAKSNHTLYNPAGELELPKLEKRLPKHVLSATEADTVINQIDLSDPLGLLIPFANSGYAGGFSGQLQNLNNVTIITQQGMPRIITGFPGNGLPLPKP